MEIKIIKTEAEYEAALARIETLMDAAPESPEEEELELLALLVEKYEDEQFPFDLPDPVEAIRFRMEQEGLEPKDMVKYLGSQSKVSEVLNRRRPLSLAMIRSLHEGLGIPAEVLLQEPGGKLAESTLNYLNYPFAEMFKRGYFQGFGGTLAQAKVQAEELLTSLFSVLSSMPQDLVYCRRSDQEVDMNALQAWQAKVLHIALQEELPPFSKDEFTVDFIREVVKLSYFSQGPQMAPELLNKIGIHFVILPHLPKTYLDGACFYVPDGRPVVAMTLRHDRLDNFWFTLIHELAHIYLHLVEKNKAFFDDTEQILKGPEHPLEDEANQLTQDLLIAPDEWREVANQLENSKDERLVLEVAERLLLHPAIIAGRIRWETRDYFRFNELIGSKGARRQFLEGHDSD